jgi:hypothetical protein
MATRKGCSITNRLYVPSSKHEMRWISAVVLAAAAFSLSGATHAARHDTLPGLTPARLAQLRELVVRVASEMGEQHPTNAVVLASTQCDFFARIDGGELAGCGFDVFVVAYEGDFVAYGAPRPYRSPAPRGHFAFSVLNAKTFDGTDFGLMNDPVDISRFGPSIPLDLDG